MAQYELLLPKMGESVAEATVIKWVKQPGDIIELDDTILEIATDKVDSEVPSPVAGKLVNNYLQEDEVAQVGDVIAIIEIESGGTSNRSKVSPLVETRKQQLFLEKIPGLNNFQWKISNNLF